MACWLRAELEEGLAAVVQAGGWAFSQTLARGDARVGRRAAACSGRGDPLEPGLAVAELLPAEPWAPAVLPLLPIERRGGMAYLPGVAASLGARAEAAEALGRELEAAGLAAVKVDDAELARYLEADGRLVRLGDGFVGLGRPPTSARASSWSPNARAAGEITLARFRDLAGVGRRDAQLLLERLDQDGITRRLGDRRVLRRAGRRLSRTSWERLSLAAARLRIPLGLVVDPDRVGDPVDVVEVARSPGSRRGSPRRPSRARGARRRPRARPRGGSSVSLTA